MDEETIRKKLSEEEYHVLREKGTEKPGSSKFLDFSKPGTYYCKVCNSKLFTTKEQFNNSCGWPSFFGAEKNAIKKKWDFSYGMIRLAVSCKKCGSHLGHWFPDGPKFKRYCINGISLKKK
jgi:peptide-methionine (R)-S-oxide reductase